VRAEVSIDEAQTRLAALAQHAAAQRQRVTLTQEGRAVAVLLSVQELDDLEDAAALADYRAREAAGKLTLVPHEEVRRRLGPPSA
jgi:prevent-host-death family protein